MNICKLKTLISIIAVSIINFFNGANMAFYLSSDFGNTPTAAQSAQLKPQGPGGAYPPSVPNFNNASSTIGNYATGPGAAGTTRVTPTSQPASNPQPTSTPTTPQPASIDPILQAAEDAFNAIMGTANKTENALREQQPGLEQGVNDAYNNNLNVANTQKAQGERAIASEKESAGVRFQNAITAARQALAESLQGGKQRFGRGSDVFKALGEYGTTKFQQASGQARDSMETTARALSDQWQTLNENFTNAVMQLNTWKEEQIRTIKNDFQNRLLQIQSMRDEASVNKANVRIQALMSLNDQINSINAQATQYAQQLELTKQAYTNQFSQKAIELGASNQTAATNIGNTNASANASIDLNPVAATGGTSGIDPSILNSIGMAQSGKKYDPVTGQWR